MNSLIYIGLLLKLISVVWIDTVVKRSLKDYGCDPRRLSFFQSLNWIYNVYTITERHTNSRCSEVDMYCNPLLLHHIQPFILSLTNWTITIGHKFIKYSLGLLQWAIMYNNLRVTMYRSLITRWEPSGDTISIRSRWQF